VLCIRASKNLHKNGMDMQSEKVKELYSNTTKGESGKRN
jgi:hypothetical protein